MASGAAIAGQLIFGVGAAGKSHQSAESTRKAAKTRADITRLENAATRREQVRELTRQRGSFLAASAAAGGGPTGQIGDTGTRGAIQALRSQFRSNINFLDEANVLNARASFFEDKAVKFQSEANLFQSLSNLIGSSGSSFGGGMSGSGGGGSSGGGGASAGA